MGKRKRPSSYEFNDTATTLAIAVFGGACVFISVESTLPDLMDLWGRQIDKIPRWQIHMGSACCGTTAFFVFLFILEVHETRSRLTAWRSSAPWLPLIGLTLLATIVDIPYYFVIPVGAICGVWAYRLTSGVRSSPRLQ